MKPDLPERLAIAQRMLRTIIEAMPAVTFNANSAPQLYLVSLHLTIVQLCGGCLVMAKTEYTAGIPILLRSLYDALVDMENLISDPSYHENMDAANAEQILKIMKQSPSNRLLRNLLKSHNIPELTQILTAQADELNARGRRKLDMRVRCRNVNREQEYESLFAFFCLDAHNNVAALVDRHIREASSKKLQVNAFGDGDLRSLAKRIHFAIGWMLQSAEVVHRAFSTQFDVSSLLIEHDSLRLNID